MKKMVKSPLLRSAKMPMLELVLVIGYFSVISVFILQLFLSANMLQSKAKDEGKAIIQCEKFAETVKAADSFEQAKKEYGLLKYSKIDDKKQIEKVIMDKLEKETEDLFYMLHFDKDWNESKTESVYTMVIIPSINTEFCMNMEEYDVYVFRLQEYVSLSQQEGNKELYHLHFTKYRR